MRPRKEFRYRLYLSFLAIGVIFSSRTALTQSIPKFYFVNTSPSGVCFYDSLKKNFDFTLIDNNPTMAVLEPTGRLLYIIHDGLPNTLSISKKVKLRRPSSLSIIDVSSKKVLKKIPLGWNAMKMGIVNNNYLIILGRGNQNMKEQSNGTGSGFVTIINAQDGNIIFSTNRYRWIQDITWTSDFSRIIIFGVDDFQYMKPVCIPWQHKVSILNIKGDIINEITLPSLKNLSANRILRSGDKWIYTKYVISKDQNWLYLFDPSEKSKKFEKSRDGRIFVVDLNTGKLAASHNLGNQPSLLLRNPSNGNLSAIKTKFPKENQIQISGLNGIHIYPQVILNSKADMFVQSEASGGLYAIDKRLITFVPDSVGSTWQQKELKPLQDRIVFFKQLPSKGRIAVFSGSNEYGIIDGVGSQIINTGYTGRAGIRAAKVLGQTILSVGVSLTGSFLLGQPYFFFAGTQPTFSSCLTRADDEYLYVLNTSSNDVTVINTDNGLVFDKIPVGLSCSGMALTPDGTYLFALSPYKITVINTETNKKYDEIKLETSLGVIKDIEFVDATGRSLILFENAIQFWDIQQKKITLLLSITSKPAFLICPNFTLD